MLVNLGRIDVAGEAQRITPVWYEVHALDLTNGSDQILGGFPPNELTWDAGMRRNTRASALLDDEWMYAGQHAAVPVFDWTPDGRLLVLDTNMLYLMDMNAAKSDKLAAPPFLKFNIAQTDAQDFAFWNNTDVVFWGEQSIWKLQFTTRHTQQRTGKGQQFAQN
jgi:hypothetical protein